MPALNTSSLPDLIFTILFFFMIVTTMREVTLMVEFRVPKGTEIEKMTKKSLVSYIYVGKPTREWRARVGSGTQIQLNDAFRTAKDIGDFIAAEREQLNEADRAQMTTSIKADEFTKMGIITDVKQELRRANALKISYAAIERQSNNN